MTVKLTSREKRVVGAGIILVIAVLVFYAATALFPNRDNLTQTVEQNRRLLLKQRELLNMEDVYRNRMEQYHLRLERSRNRLLPGANASIAGAELQKILTDFAEQNGVQIIQKNTLPEKRIQDNDTLMKVSVRIETNCTLEQLVHFLTDIKNYDKYLKVEELVILSVPIPNRSEIRPSLTVIGYINSGDFRTEQVLPTVAASIDPISLRLHQ
jgi:hypothetical protein